jgi:hypothetical protein
MGGGFPPFSSRVENGNGSIGRLGLRWRLGKLGGGARSVRNGHVQFSNVVMCFPLADEAGGENQDLCQILAIYLVRKRIMNS